MYLGSLEDLKQCNKIFKLAIQNKTKTLLNCWIVMVQWILIFYRFRYSL